MQSHDSESTPPVIVIVNPFKGPTSSEAYRVRGVSIYWSAAGCLSFASFLFLFPLPFPFFSCFLRVVVVVSLVTCHNCMVFLVLSAHREVWKLWGLPYPSMQPFAVRAYLMIIFVFLYLLSRIDDDDDDDDLFANFIAYAWVMACLCLSVFHAISFSEFRLFFGGCFSVSSFYDLTRFPSR